VLPVLFNKYFSLALEIITKLVPSLTMAKIIGNDRQQGKKQ
jgi:hypothetical protein